LIAEQPGRPGRRGLAVPAVASLVAFAVLIGLGIWQLERKAWKEALIAALEARAAATPVELPRAATWDRLDRAEMEFRRIKFPAEFFRETPALVYTSGSTLRSDSGPGYWVFAPARAAGGIVMVNRGFLPQDRKDLAASRAGGEISGPIDLLGALRWPDARSWFTPADEPEKNLWFVRDPAAIAAAKRLGPVAPFYVEQEWPAPPGGLPAPGKLRPNLPNNHLQYAVTWFGLAAVLAGMFGAYAWGRARES